MEKERAIATISSKRQITLPASMCRALGLMAGDKLTVTLCDGQIVLKLRPENYTEAYHGKLKGIYGTVEEIEEYLKEERKSWYRKAGED